MKKELTVNISHNLTSEEWECIDIFKEKALQLMATEIMSNPDHNISANLHFEKGKGLKYKVKLPPENILKLFLMTFRFFYLSKEKSNFNRVANIVKRRSSDATANAYIDRLKSMWDGSLFRSQLKIKVNQQPLTASYILDLWFNAYYFHADDKKRLDLKIINEILSSDFSKYMFVHSAYDASKAVLRLFKSLASLQKQH